MTKETFLARLNTLLMPLPQQEREDALRYYEDYFDAAGQENEQQTATELGSPEMVAQKILEATGVEPKGQGSDRKSKVMIWGLLTVAIVVAVLLASRMILAQKQQPAPAAVQAAPTAEATALPTSQTMEEFVTITDEQPAAQINTLEVEINIGNITFVEEDTASMISVTAKHARNKYFSASRSGKTYRISDDTSNSGTNVKADDGPHITITIPRGTKLNIKVTNNFGSVDLGEITAETIDAELDFGSLEGGTVTVAELDASCDMGDVHFNGLTGAKKVEIDCGMGNIELTVAGAPTSYAFTGDCSMGRIDYNGEEIPMLGDDAVKRNAGAPNTLELSCDMGNIEVAFSA